MALIHSILMGAVAGMRAMTPLAAVTNAARSGNLPADNGAPRLLANKLASAGMLALAGGELVGTTRTSDNGVANRNMSSAVVIQPSKNVWREIRR